MKFNTKTNPALATFGKDMYKALVTDQVVNQQISDDDYTKEMADKRVQGVAVTSRVTAAVVLLSACSRSPGSAVANETPRPAPVASDTASTAGDHAMINLLQELVRFLSREPLTIEEVAARVGPIRDDPGVPMEIELAPALAGVRAAHLSRYPDSGKPYMLRLELVSPVSISALRAAFGEYQREPTDRGMPREIGFHPPSAEPRWTVAVFARLPAGATPIDDSMTSSIVTLQREPR